MVVLTGLFGRLIKAYPKVPPTALPWLVLGCGYVISFVAGLQAGLGIQPALVAAWQGLAAGVVAVGSHESLKGLLVPIAGEDGARLLLGKLPGTKVHASRFDE